MYTVSYHHALRWISGCVFHTLPADIDECELMADVCQQNCTNTEGSFNCSCFSGFVLLSDGSSCAGEWYIHAVVELLYTCTDTVHYFSIKSMRM